MLLKVLMDMQGDHMSVQRHLFGGLFECYYFCLGTISVTSSSMAAVVYTAIQGVI